MREFLHSGLISTYKKSVETGTFTNEISKLQATGIPPHLTMANELNQVKQSVLESKQEVLQRCSQLPEKVKESMMASSWFNNWKKKVGIHL